MRSQPETGVEPKAGEAGREVTLQQGLGTWTGSQRTGSSTHALVEQVCSRSNMLHHVRRGALVATPIFTSPVFARRWSSSAVLYNPASFAMLRSVSPAAYPSPNPDLTLACATSRARDECAHFCLWTGWATQRLSIPTELSFTRCRLTPRARILITGSSVVEMRCCATSGAGQGGRKSCALMTGEVAEPFRWLCSTGYMLKLFHSSSCHASVKCCGGPPYAAAH